MANDMFFSTLKGVRYEDLYREILSLDRTVESYNERVENVDKIINKNPYLKTYFDSYYDPHLTQEDSLSEDHNIAHLVEMLTNYLLMSNEAKDLENKDKTYYIDSNSLDKNHKETASDVFEDSNYNNLAVVKFDKSNIIKQKKVKITASDLKEDSETGSILRELQEAKDDASYRIKNGIGNRFKLSNFKHQLNQDQIQTKISLKGVFGLNTTPTFSIDDIEHYNTLSEYRTVKQLLTLQGYDEVGFETMDLQRLLTEIPFSERDKDIIYMYSQGYPAVEIAMKYHISQQRISYKIDKLSQRIAKYNHLKHSRCLLDNFEEKAI